ncbi:hypothetical protein FKP32DRAFT_1168921 [Trametes sanguinea]|nr:hypothetical protein FKP32DRAFT_1168921 [Trametes sanguinea]
MSLSLTRRRLSSVSGPRLRLGLGAVKTSLELLSRAGTPVPGLQAVVETVLKIIEYAEAVKRNRDESRELAVSAAQIVEALLHAIGSSHG